MEEVAVGLVWQVRRRKHQQGRLGHRKTHGAAVVSLADAGKVEEAQREFLFIRRGGRAARASVAKEKPSVEQEQVVVLGLPAVSP